MGVTFSAADRLAVTRRQLNILLENQAYQASSNAFTDQQTKLQQVDQSNSKFYDFYNTMVQAYETEAQALDGAISATYMPSDLDGAAQNPSQPPFFPVTPAPAYSRSIPLIADGTFTNNAVRGRFFPTGTLPQYEGNIITNPSNPSQGLTQLLGYLLNGITGSGGFTTSTTSIPAGPVTGLVLTVTSLGGIGNETVYIGDGTNSGIYIVTATAPHMITVSSILPATSPISSPALTDTVAGFTNTERQTLTTGSYQMILTNISTGISALVTAWQTAINAQITAIGTNNEDRATYMTQNSAALTSDNAALTPIAAWLALPNTGISGRFTDTSLAPIQSLMATRTSYISSRIGQVNTALGTSGSAALSQSGETFTATDQTNPYFKRFTWINFRINRATGSLRRYYGAGQNQAGVQQFLTDNTNIKGQYDTYFLTKALTANDGSNIIHVTDLTGINPSDHLTVVSETQPELPVVVVQLMGTTQIQLDQAVPQSYKLADKARVFKTL